MAKHAGPNNLSKTSKAFDSPSLLQIDSEPEDADEMAGFANKDREIEERLFEVITQAF